MREQPLECVCELRGNAKLLREEFLLLKKSELLRVTLLPITLPPALKETQRKKTDFLLRVALSKADIC